MSVTNETARTILREASVYNADELHVQLWYPDVPCEAGEIHKIVVGLIDVRAADDIRISYDKGRDGWSIEQASRFEWGPDDDTDCDQDWQEVAFVQAWAREVKLDDS